MSYSTPFEGHMAIVGTAFKASKSSHRSMPFFVSVMSNGLHIVRLMLGDDGPQGGPAEQDIKSWFAERF